MIFSDAYICHVDLQVMKIGEFKGQKVQDVKKLVQKTMIDKVRNYCTEGGSTVNMNWSKTCVKYENCNIFFKLSLFLQCFYAFIIDLKN